ncbi:Jag N-terminal domain-containing protein [Hydrogenimonas sp.]
MKQFEAPTLEEAYAEAAKAFSCSVTELDIRVVQHPSKGFFGFGRRPAVIVASCPAQERKKEQKQKAQTTVSEPRSREEKELKEEGKRPSEPRHEVSESKAGSESEAVSEEELAEKAAIAAVVEEVIAESAREAARMEEVREEEEERKEKKEAEPAAGERKEPEKEGAKGEVAEVLVKNRDIFDNFYQDAPDIHAIVPEIEEKINALFSHACFKIDPIKVAAFDDETVLVEFGGEDAALLIGKEGYRYKALAQLLYNWIHSVYGFRLRLEIAQFLQNQETMIENYLQPIIERAEKEGRAQTKVLDGILVQIALKRLRERFPDKYVAVRTNKEGGRFVIVNERMEKR